MRIDRPAHDAGVVSPYDLQQVDAGRGITMTLVEREEEIELLRSQRDCLAIAYDGSGQTIDPDGSKLENVTVTGEGMPQLAITYFHASNTTGDPGSVPLVGFQLPYLAAIVLSRGQTGIRDGGDIHERISAFRLGSYSHSGQSGDGCDHDDVRL